MNRNTFLLAVLALVAVCLATPLQLLGIPLAPIVALVLGAIAGWWISSVRGRGTAEGGVVSGAIVGLGALIGSIIALAVVALFIGNIPEVQQLIQSSEPHPEARLPSNLIAPLALLSGVLGGFMLGIADMVLAALSGMIAGVIYGHRHPVKA